MKKFSYSWEKYTKIDKKVWYFNGQKIKEGKIYKKENDYDFSITDNWKSIKTNIKHFNIKPFTDKGKIELLESVWHMELFVLENKIQDLKKEILRIKNIVE